VTVIRSASCLVARVGTYKVGGKCGPAESAGERNDAEPRVAARRCWAAAGRAETGAVRTRNSENSLL
jgi:hypothetical protein